MAKCAVCGKGPQFGNNVSHSHLKTRRRWDPNVQRVSLPMPGGRTVQAWVCTRCLRTLAKEPA